MRLAQLFRGALNIVKRAGDWMASWSSANWNRIQGDVPGQSPVRMPYAQSAWVSGAIKKIAQPIGAVPLRFEDEKTETEIEDEKLEAFWKRPARNLTWFDTIQATVGWLNLQGEAFWILGDEWNVPFPESRQMEPFLVVRPDRMEHVVMDGQLMGWKFTDKMGRAHNLQVEQVIHFKFWNPYDEWRGLAPYLAAQIATEADYYAATFNRNLWEQSGDRGPYITHKTGVLTNEQREQIVAQLKEKRAAAARGQFKAAFFTGDISVEDPKIQTLDASAVTVRLGNRHEIAIAFGVPPSMFDVVASYSIGSASDRFILIEETCMPTAAKIAEEITRLAQRMLRNERVCAYFDWDEHSTMQAVRRERIASAMQLWQMGQPMESINEYLRMGMKPFPGWDVGFLPFSVAPVESVTNPEPQSDLPTDDDFDPVDEADEEAGNLGASLIRSAFRKREDFSAWQSRRPKRELAIVRTHTVKQNQIEKRYFSAFNRVLFEARAKTLKTLEQMQSGTKSIATRAAATDIIFDRHSFTRMLVATMRKVSAQALDEAGQTVMDEMEIRDPWKTPPGEVIDFNRLRQQKIVGVAANVRDRINNAVDASIKEGESIAKMADRIKTEFNNISKGQAKTIARTETGAAYGQGRQVAMESAGVQYKEWVTSGLPNVRPEHVQANGQRVRVNDKFDVGGEQLESPGDPKGSAGNVINCNCVAIAVAGPGEEE